MNIHPVDQGNWHFPETADDLVPRRGDDLRLAGYHFTATENAVGYPSAQTWDEPNYAPVKYTPVRGGGR